MTSHKVLKPKREVLAVSGLLIVQALEYWWRKVDTSKWIDIKTVHVKT